uniref:Ovule protein n=1 Tax=Strongyloides venezuelensis TaxID=75913 RepID=A0A0K0G4J4_STRVS
MWNLILYPMTSRPSQSYCPFSRCITLSTKFKDLAPLFSHQMVIILFKIPQIDVNFNVYYMQTIKFTKEVRFPK